ncbi:hypothetical protein CJ030_MR4G015722 [Morella rubra]|uniref:Uncharacterized protein n=1 Tax=Morella rubra TaxID=262757 RepID=A0A6A1VVA1_9ROSI|nr:hypothetical protein CJ030_MR4G015722 [Morella rubra]
MRIEAHGLLKSEPFDGEREESVLGGLVKTVLSQNTTEVNSQRAFESLKSAFPTWEDVCMYALFFCLGFSNWFLPGGNGVNELATFLGICVFWPCIVAWHLSVYLKLIVPSVGNKKSFSVSCGLSYPKGAVLGLQSLGSITCSYPAIFFSFSLPCRVVGRGSSLVDQEDLWAPLTDP